MTTTNLDRAELLPRARGSAPEAAGRAAGRLRPFGAHGRRAAARAGSCAASGEPARARGALALVALSALGALAACAPEGPAVVRLGGRALGTTWSLVLVDEERDADEAALRALVEDALDAVDLAASTWRDDSEVAAFAALAPGATLALSDDLAAILAVARDVHDASGGAFDPTVGPLVAAYGFGAGAPDGGAASAGTQREAPDEATLEAAAARVDFAAVVWADGALGRTRDDVTLDLSGVAKGHAVDRIAERLIAAGEARFLVEVGGELRLAGTRVSGDPWGVGVDEPTLLPPAGPPGSAGRPIHCILGVSDAAVATSGDYRAYRTLPDGRRVSHTIDPRAGRAVTNDVASVTVVAPTCALADALATAVLVLGADGGLALLETRPEVEGLVLLHAGDGVTERATSGFAALRSE